MADNEMLTGYLAGQSDNNNGMFGGDGSWIWALLILGLLGGGFGFGGGFGGFGGGRGGCCGAPCATQADVRAAVDQQTLISKLDQQTYGLADSTYALNNTITNGFHGVDNAVCNLGFNMQTGFNGISRQLSECCCDTRAAIKDVQIGAERNAWNLSKQISDCCCDVEKMNMQNRFDAAQANCGTLQAIDKLGDRIIGYLTDQETRNLRDEVQAYRLKASQAQQNQYLIEQLRPCPVPAYITCNPFAASHGYRGNGGYSNSCGCGCAA
jgi:hypothetical protein